MAGIVGAPSSRRRRHVYAVVLALVVAAGGEEAHGPPSPPPPLPPPQPSERVSMIALGRTLVRNASALISSAAQSDELISWTSLPARSMLATTGVCLRPVIRGVATRISLISHPWELIDEPLDGGAVIGSYNATNLTVAGMNTLTDFAVVADDHTHFNVTSQVEELRASILVELSAAFRIGPLRLGPPVRVKFVVASVMRDVQLTTRWKCELSLGALRRLGGRVSCGSVLAVIPEVTNVTMRIRNPVLSVHVGQATDETLEHPPPVLWRLLSSAIARDLTRLLEHEIAEAVYGELHFAR